MHPAAGLVWTRSRGAVVTSELRQDACPGAGFSCIGERGQVKAGSSSRVARHPAWVPHDVSALHVPVWWQDVLADITAVQWAVRALHHQC